MGIPQPIHIVPNRSKIKSLARDFIAEKKPNDAFFLCNIGDIAQKHQKWVAAMPRIKPFYAIKCNDDENVIRLLAALGTGFDVASQGEMAKVIGLGVHESRIIFANPTKLPSHIQAAEKFNVSLMTFDNVCELRKIKVLHPTARLLIRIRYDADKALILLGKKFGVSVDDAPLLLAAAQELGLNVVGVCFHVGTGCMDPPVFRRAIASAKWLFNVGYELGFNINVLDIGGGFPGNTGSDITEIANIVNSAIDDFFPEGCGVEFLAEPGRFYVASAFQLFTQIHSLRECKNEKGEKNFMYYINDGVYGSFNCVFTEHTVLSPQTLRHRSDSRQETAPCSIWGPTCDSFDHVCPCVVLPEMELGEWLLFHDMGAYSISTAGTFNGFPLSKVHYIVTEEAWSVLKRMVEYENPFVEDGPLCETAGLGCAASEMHWDGAAHPRNKMKLSLDTS